MGLAPSILPRFCRLDAEEAAFREEEVMGARIGIVDVAMEAIRPVTWPTSLSSNYGYRKHQNEDNSDRVRIRTLDIFSDANSSSLSEIEKLLVC